MPRPTASWKEKMAQKASKDGPTLVEFDAQGLVYSLGGKHYGPGVCKVDPKNFEVLDKKQRQINGEDVRTPEEISSTEVRGTPDLSPRETRQRDLESNTVPKLVVLAEQRGIPIASRKKEDLVASILAHEFDETEEDVDAGKDRDDSDDGDVDTDDDVEDEEEE
jgi:hypothetical protein